MKTDTLLLDRKIGDIQKTEPGALHTERFAGWIHSSSDEELFLT